MAQHTLGWAKGKSLVNSDYLIPAIVRQQLLRPNSAEVIEQVSGGLSAAWVFRCQSHSRGACLRRWPSGHPSPERLASIHRALEQAWRAGNRFVPRPLHSLHGQTTVFDGSHLWELSHWLPGQADYLDRPSPQRLQQVARKLAQLHDTWSAQSTRGASLAAVSRFQTLSGWLEQLDSRKAQLSYLVEGQSTEVAELALRTLSQLSLLGPSLLPRLRLAVDAPVTLHFVIRDIWSDHILFEGGEVTGIVDFGAARVDEPATDLARLLASLEPSHASAWEAALVAYEEIAQPVDRNRLAVLDQASALLSAAQWLDWIVLQPRQFDTPSTQRVARWAGFLRRLEQGWCFGG